MFNRAHPNPMLRAMLLVCLLVLTACKKDKKEEAEEMDVSFTTQKISAESLEACKDAMCPTIDIDLSRPEGDSPLANSINAALDKLLMGNLSLSPEDEKDMKTVDQGIGMFIAAFREDKEDFPESAAGYEITATDSISHDNNGLLTLMVDAYNYFGGAHGYGSTTYLNFDKFSGKQLDNEELVKDKMGLLAFAEKKFKEQQQIPKDGDINATGYFFEDNVFVLPQNMGFVGNDLILLYNPYEAAAYAVGQIEIKLPVSEVAQYLAYPKLQ